MTALRVLLLGAALGLSAGEVPWATDGTATFSSDLAAPVVCAVPDGGLTLSRIVSRANVPISFTGSALLTLTAGGAATPPLDYRPTASYAPDSLVFSMPILFTGEGQPDGVPLLYLGGCTFSNAVTLAARTKTLSIRRVRASAFCLRSPAARADFTRAAALELGQTETKYQGVGVSLGFGAQLLAPRTTLAMGGTFTLLNSTPAATFVATNAASGGYADFLMPDASYRNGANPVYAQLTIQGGRFVCRRLAQGHNDGAKIVLAGGTLTATAGITLQATNGAAMTVTGGTIRTPDFNTQGTAPAFFGNNATFNVDGQTTEVGRVTFAARAGLSVTGSGAIAFRQGGTIPRLTLGAETTLFFKEVAPDVPPLELGALNLPAQGNVRMRVTNRMLTGRTTVATGLTAEHLARLTVEVPACGRLELQDGRLDFVIDGLDLSQPATATWIGCGVRAAVDDPANWRCRDALGAIMPGAVPTSATLLDTVTGRTNLSLPEDAALNYPDGVLAGKVTLSSDCDWRGFSPRAFAADLTVDTAGHALRLPQMPYPVRGRALKPGREIYYEAFGAQGDGATDDQAALAEAHRYANVHGIKVRARDDATYYIGGGAVPIVIKTDVDFGTARFILDDRNVADYTAHVFIVPPSTPAYALTGLRTLARGQRNLGRTFDRPSLVTLEEKTTRRYIRSGSNANVGSVQQEVLYVDRRGFVDARTPVLWDYTNITSCTVSPADERLLTLSGGRFTTYSNQDPAGANEKYYQRNFYINRSKVLIRNLEHQVVEDLSATASSAPYTGFLSVCNAADVTIRDSIFCGHRRTVQGTYDLSATRTIRLAFKNCRQSNDITDTGYWGIFGSNFCKDTLFEGCAFSRFDAHQGVCHATLRNCRLNSINAIGFGTLLVENTTVHGRAFITLRSDYGSSWEGEFIVRNSTFAPSVGGSQVLVSAANDGTHDYGYACSMPKRIVLDGLHIADTLTGDKLYLFSDVAISATSADYAWTYPYALTERVVLHNVTIDSGSRLQDNVSRGNAWLFRNVVFETGPPPTPEITLDAPELGWNLTNAAIRVSVADLDPAATGCTLTLTVRDAAGDTVAVADQSIGQAGSANFRIALPEAGAHYTYTASLRQGPFLADAATTRDAFAGTVEPGVWFQADVAGNQPVGANGVWQCPPGDVRADGAYTVDGEAAFALLDAAAGAECTVKTELVYPVDDLAWRDGGELPDEALAALCAATSDNGGAYWCGLRTGPSGAREWFPLAGHLPETGKTYQVCSEIDFRNRPSRVRYGVRTVGAAAYTILSNETGATWHTAGISDATTMREVRLRGHGAAGKIVGIRADGALAEVNGVRYGDLREALAHAAAQGGCVTLLADVSFVPEASTGTVTLDFAGHRLIWQETKGFTFSGDAATGRFRAAAATADGSTANGHGGYVSYVLGLDADDPDSHPRLTLAPDNGTFVLSLTPLPPTGTGAILRYRLLASETPDFADCTCGAWDTSPHFTLDPGDDKRFFRLQIDLQKPE